MKNIQKTILALSLLVTSASYTVSLPSWDSLPTISLPALNGRNAFIATGVATGAVALYKFRKPVKDIIVTCAQALKNGAITTKNVIMRNKFKTAAALATAGVIAYLIKYYYNASDVIADQDTTTGTTGTTGITGTTNATGTQKPSTDVIGDASKAPVVVTTVQPVVTNTEVQAPAAITPTELPITPSEVVTPAPTPIPVETQTELPTVTEVTIVAEPGN